MAVPRAVTRAASAFLQAPVGKLPKWGAAPQAPQPEQAAGQAPHPRAPHTSESELLRASSDLLHQRRLHLGIVQERVPFPTPLRTAHDHHEVADRKSVV